jgi:hypothetical protein
MRWLRWGLLILLLLLLGPLMTVISGTVDLTRDWRTASRESAGLAPDPVETREAVIQVYAARASGWRGAFAVHSWIAVKPTDAPTYTVYQMVGWRDHVHHGLPNLVGTTDVPDPYWFGNRPELLAELRGDGVNQVIQRIEQAVRAYPYVDQYRLWPGPNSNTFTAFIGRRVPELALDLPPTAIGKDYLADGAIFAPSPSGTGFQVSLLGLLGLLVGRQEGLEVNVLSLTFGIDPLAPALKLPGLGRIGPARR